MYSSISPTLRVLSCYKFFCFFFFLALTACTKEEIEVPRSDNFYSNALVSANRDLLLRNWSVYEAHFEGNKADIPTTYEECGRDFFQFTDEGRYREYIITGSYECETQVLDLDWELDSGILTFTNTIGQEQEMVLLALKQDKMTFKMKVDLEGDGDLQIFTFVARPYSPPNDRDFYSHTFHPVEVQSSRDKIEFTWMSYSGFYPFVRYEIYRSTNSCSKVGAELLATIDDPLENTFIDEDPPADKEICYFLKIYNEKGLLGESPVMPFDTEYLRPAEVGFTAVNATEEQIGLQWQPYDGNYFSHYEIRVRNYEGGSGSGFREESLATIEDRETTNFTDENPPQLLNPIYAIYAYDIFGNVSSEPYHSSNTIKVSDDRPGILKFDLIQFMAADDEQPEVYLYGKKSGEMAYDLVKYNYKTRQVTAATNKVPGGSTSVDMQVVSTPNGKELFYPQGTSLAVYNAADLSYKYDLNTGYIGGFTDFAYVGNNLWMFVNNSKIYTFKRENGNLSLIDQSAHGFEIHSSYNYHLTALKNGEVLVGHHEEPQSRKYRVGADEEISGGELVDIPIKSKWKTKTLYSPMQDYVINLPENRIYSTLTYNFLESFEAPYFPSGISRNGDRILGTNNNPENYSENAAGREKKALVYNFKTKQVQSFPTKGYPHLLFENHLGEIISISSGFNRSNLEKTTPMPDIFVEKIN